MFPNPHQTWYGSQLHGIVLYGIACWYNRIILPAVLYGTNMECNENEEVKLLHIQIFFFRCLFIEICLRSDFNTPGFRLYQTVMNIFVIMRVLSLT